MGGLNNIKFVESLEKLWNAEGNMKEFQHISTSLSTKVYLMYVCPCIIYEIDERYPLDATIYLLL